MLGWDYAHYHGPASSTYPTGSESAQHAEVPFTSQQAVPWELNTGQASWQLSRHQYSAAIPGLDRTNILYTRIHENLPGPSSPDKDLAQIFDLPHQHPSTAWPELVQSITGSSSQDQRYAQLSDIVSPMFRSGPIEHPRASTSTPVWNSDWTDIYQKATSQPSTSHSLPTVGKGQRVALTDLQYWNKYRTRRLRDRFPANVDNIVSTKRFINRRKGQLHSYSILNTPEMHAHINSLYFDNRLHWADLSETEAKLARPLSSKTRVAFVLPGHPNIVIHRHSFEDPNAAPVLAQMFKARPGNIHISLWSEPQMIVNAHSATKGSFLTDFYGLATIYASDQQPVVERLEDFLKRHPPPVMAVV